MSEDITMQLASLVTSLEGMKAEFEQATACCVSAIEGMHHRMERLEKWMDYQKAQSNKIIRR